MATVKRVGLRRLGAELVVVFVGVFLGLFADDWRGRQVDAGRERLALEGMLEDLAKDSAELDGIVSAGSQWNAAASWAVLHEGDAIHPDSAAGALAGIHLPYVFNPQRANYASLTAAGMLGVISDDVLRARISEYFEVSQPGLSAAYALTESVWVAFSSGRQAHLRWVYPMRRPPRMILITSWASASRDRAFMAPLEELGAAGLVLGGWASLVLSQNAELRELIGRALRAK